MVGTLCGPRTDPIRLEMGIQAPVRVTSVPSNTFCGRTVLN